jgi:hypothetical protein
MRIRDRLLALATASLAPSRSAPRGTSGGHEHADQSQEAGVGTAAGPPTGESPLPLPDLPRQLAEQLLQSNHASQQRLVQTGEALSVIASAVSSVEQTLRQHLEAATAGAPPPAASLAAGVMTLALHAANARAIDGTYLFCGTQDAPFAPDGTYLGPSTSSLLVVQPSPPSVLAIAAAALTSLAPFRAPVDILPRIARAQAACGSTNPRTLETCLAPLSAAASQLALLQQRVTSALTVLAEATNLTEAALPARSLTESEPEHNPSQLAQTFGALEAARSLAERTLAIFPTP